MPFGNSSWSSLAMSLSVYKAGSKKIKSSSLVSSMGISDTDAIFRHVNQFRNHSDDPTHKRQSCPGGRKSWQVLQVFHIPMVSLEGPHRPAT
mmetsp:Transcript_8827/g.19603  ORF Transcript_8827/g.19603 Transcript_8827/m.19603 type:complete len:92 (+) Transcript_8827:177-452(+)